MFLSTRLMIFLLLEDPDYLWKTTNLFIERGNRRIHTENNRSKSLTNFIMWIRKRYPIGGGNWRLSVENNRSDASHRQTLSRNVLWSILLSEETWDYP